MRSFPRKKGRKVRAVVVDVDGVLTEGGIRIGDDGQESKRFHVRDGLGIRLLLDAGIVVGIITGRRSQVVEKRVAELGLTFCHQGIKDKWSVLSHELETRSLPVDSCAYMGDDLNDLSILTRVGLSAAPADADPEVMKRVHWRAPLPGGGGAVRLLAEGILKAQGQWPGIMQRMIDGR